MLSLKPEPQANPSESIQEASEEHIVEAATHLESSSQKDDFIENTRVPLPLNTTLPLHKEVYVASISMGIHYFDTQDCI